LLPFSYLYNLYYLYELFYAICLICQELQTGSPT
jgi:hypothetical protein